MKKYILCSIISVIISLLTFIFFRQIFYSDYRADAIVMGWSEKIQQNSRDGQFSEININQLHHAEKLLINDNLILVMGFNNRAVLLFYRNKKSEWDCVTNTKLKKMGDYYCE